MNFEEKLNPIMSRYEELTALLAGGATGDEFVKLSKELSSLEEIHTVGMKYKKMLADLKETEELLQDESADSDLKEMAQEELHSLKEQIHKRGLFSNKHLNIGIFVLVLVQLLVFFTPAGKIFGLTIITISQLLFVVLVNIVSFVIIELLKPVIVKKFKDE